MDSGGQFSSVQSGSEQRNPLFQIGQGTRENPEQQDTPDSANAKTSANHILPSLSNQPQVPPSVAINTIKSIPEVNRPEFSIPQLPSKLPTRRAHDNSDDRTSPNPAHQVLSYPMSYPQDAPNDHKMQHERPEGEERPAQRRKLSSPEREGRPGRSDDEESRKTSGTNKASSLSYDPVHETQHASMLQQQPGHSRRPSSANSQRSRISSYSGQSSNPDAEGSSSPITGDTGTSRDGKKRKHKCPECGQYFTRLHNLKSHLLTHSQEKPFICHECGHKFRRLHDLKRRSRY